MCRYPDKPLNDFLQIFSELWPFENLGILNLSAKYLKTLSARYFRLGHPVGDD